MASSIGQRYNIETSEVQYGSNVCVHFSSDIFFFLSFSFQSIGLRENIHQSYFYIDQIQVPSATRNHKTHVTWHIKKKKKETEHVKKQVMKIYLVVSKAWAKNGFNLIKKKILHFNLIFHAYFLFFGFAVGWFVGWMKILSQKYSAWKKWNCEDDRLWYQFLFKNSIEKSEKIRTTTMKVNGDMEACENEWTLITNSSS